MWFFKVLCNAFFCFIQALFILFCGICSFLIICRCFFKVYFVVLNNKLIKLICTKFICCQWLSAVCNGYAQCQPNCLYTRSWHAVRGQHRHRHRKRRQWKCIRSSRSSSHGQGRVKAAKPSDDHEQPICSCCSSGQFSAISSIWSILKSQSLVLHKVQWCMTHCTGDCY